MFSKLSNHVSTENNFSLAELKRRAMSILNNSAANFLNRNNHTCIINRIKTIGAISLTATLLPVIASAAPTQLGAVQSHNLITENGKQKVQFNLENNAVCIVTPYSNDIIRTQCHSSEIKPQKDIAIDKPLDQWSTINAQFLNQNSYYEIITDALRVHVTYSPNFQVHFLDASGSYYLSEDRYTEFDDQYDPLSDESYQLTKTHNRISTGYSHRAVRDMPDNEAYFGMGEHAGALNRRGQVIQGWNSDAFMWKAEKNPMYMSLPFYYGVQPATTDHPTFSYGLFFNNPIRPTVFFGKQRPTGSSDRGDLVDTNTVSMEAGGGNLDYFFFAGGAEHTMKSVLSGYTELTGMPTFLPKWAYGFHMSRWSYTQGDVQELVNRFRSDNIPLDAVYFDLDYMDQTPHLGFNADEYSDNKLHQLTLNDLYVPKPEQLFSFAQQNDVRLVPLIEAWLTIDDPKYNVADNNGYFLKDNNGDTAVSDLFFGTASWLDFTDTNTNQWWAGEVKSFLTNYPFDGIWNDLNEPADSRDTAADSRPVPLNGLVSNDGQFGTSSNDQRNQFMANKNTYANSETKVTHDILATQYTDRRPFVLSRAAWPGIQKYALNWSGDNVNEDHSAPYTDAHGMNIRTGLSVMMSGQVNFGHDVGGFVGDPSGKSMARWTEWTAFTPFFRNHSAKWGSRREPYLYGNYETDIVDAIKRRYEFMPYLYSLAYESTQTGIPMNTAKVFQFTGDSANYQSHSDQDFMFGSHVLIAPVYDQSTDSRNVYLPKDVQWYDWYDDTRFDGGQFLSVNAPVGRMPIFIREGAIIPMAPATNHVYESPEAELSIHLWPGTGQFQLYEDDGESNAFQTNGYRIAELKSSQSSAGWSLSIAAKSGSYDSGRTHITAIRHSSNAPVSVSISGTAATLANSLTELQSLTNAYYYDSVNHLTHIRIADTGNQQVISAIEEQGEGIIRLYYNTDWTTPHIVYSANGGDWTPNPGEPLQPSNINGYQVIDIAAHSIEFVLNDNNGNWDNNQNNNYSISAEGTYHLLNGQIKAGPPPAVITLHYQSQWPAVEMHYQADGQAWQSVQLEPDTLAGHFLARVEATQLTFSMTDGNGTWDNNSNNNYSIQAPGEYTLSAGIITEGIPENLIRLYVETSWENAYIIYRADNGDWVTVPVLMNDAGNPGFKYFEISATTLEFAITDGNGNWWDNSGNNFSVDAIGDYIVNETAVTPGKPKDIIQLWYKSDWAPAYLLYSADAQDWVEQPGTPLAASDFPGYQFIEFNAATLEFVAHNNGGTWDNNNDENYRITKPGLYTLDNGQLFNGSPATNIRLHVKSTWAQTYLHYSVDNGTWTSPPGMLMGEDVYPGFSTFVVTGSSLEFGINDGNGTWDSNNGNNYKVSTTETGLVDFTLENGVVKPGLPQASITVHYATTWPKAFFQYQKNQSNQWSTPPGVAMGASSLGADYFSITIADAYHLEFAINDGDDNWDNPAPMTNYMITSPGEYVLNNKVISPVGGTGPAYLEVGGLLVIEAERFIELTAKNDQEWEVKNDLVGFSGDGYAAVNDENVRIDTQYVANAPVMHYPVYFQTAGTYLIWNRGLGAHRKSDSFHIGLDGKENVTSDRLKVNRYQLGWRKGSMDGQRAQLIVENEGYHTLDVYMREDGTALDKLVLTTDATWQPAANDIGPDESVFGIPNEPMEPIETPVDPLPDTDLPIGESPNDSDTSELSFFERLMIALANWGLF